MAKPIKIRDPKLRKLLESVRGKRKKSSKKAPDSQVSFYADKARALEAELRRMKAGGRSRPEPASAARHAVSSLRVPSLPADHPFNRPRSKATKKRAKKTSRRPKGPSHLPPALLRDLGFAPPAKKRKRAKKAAKRVARHAVSSLRVPSLPADHPFNRPRSKATKKRAKKTVKRKAPVFHVKRSKAPKRVAKKTVKRKAPVFHVKRSKAPKRVAKKSKRTAKRAR
jgi:hypothetical protein